MFFTFFHSSVLAEFQPLLLVDSFNLKVKNYNLNVTELRDSDFKNAFPGIFNLTVGILILFDENFENFKKLNWWALIDFKSMSGISKFSTLNVIIGPNVHD